ARCDRRDAGGFPPRRVGPPRRAVRHGHPVRRRRHGHRHDRGAPDVIGWQRRDDGIVVLTLDDPSRNANAMNAGYVSAMASTVDRLEAERSAITGVVVTSAKDSFLVGMDLAEFSAATAGDAPAAAFFAMAATVKDQFRRLERLGRPVVAALN